MSQEVLFVDGPAHGQTMLMPDWMTTFVVEEALPSDSTWTDRASDFPQRTVYYHRRRLVRDIDGTKYLRVVFSPGSGEPKAERIVDAVAMQWFRGGEEVE